MTEFQRSPESNLPITFKAVKVRPLWAPRFWRHPIVWWRTRHIRRFIRKQHPLPEIERDPMAQAERDFIFGKED